MVEVTEEFVEAMHGRQELVQVAEVILAELPGGVALRLERGCEGAGLSRDAHIRSGLAHGCQTRTKGNSPVMKLARPAVQLASA